MLSRGNSDAGQRLRRAKSASSVHHYRSEPSQIPLDHRHAEVAAVEAFRRHNQQAALMSQAQKSAQAGQGHRKKERSSEGSHFEKSRSGARIGTSYAGGPSRSQSKMGKRKASGAAHKTSSEEQETTTITRPRRVVDTNATQDNNNKRSSGSAGDRLNHRSIRKVKSMYGPSTEPSMMQDRLRPESAAAHLDGMGDRALDHAQYHGSLGQVNTSGQRHIFRKPVASSTNTEKLKAQARDSHLQAFHKNRLRAKSSFIDPFKARLRKPSLPQLRSFNVDSSIPPFNLANYSDDVFASLPKNDAPRAIIAPRPRVLSDSIKSRFKRIIGISKRVQTFLPAQHVTATQFHFETERTTDDTESSILLAPNRPAPVPPCPPFPEGTSSSRNTSSGTTASANASHAAHSRVTSWTNSTTVDSIRTLPSQQKGLLSINEAISPDENGSSTSRDRRSLFGRALRFPLGQQSRTDANRTSEESQCLYDALRKQIGDLDTLDRTSLEGIINGSPVPPEPVLIEQIVPPAQTPTKEFGPIPSPERTIRTITTETSNDDLRRRFQDSEYQGSVSPAEADIDYSNMEELVPDVQPPANAPMPPASTKRPGALQAFSPDPERLARRHEKAQNRWQSPLQEGSPVLSRAIRYSTDDNPYELRPFPSLVPPSDLPTAIHHDPIRHIVAENEGIDAATKPAPSRGHVISPSVYSQKTADSTRASTPHRGTFVTITGRDIKTYTISPTREQEPNGRSARPHGSRE